jgi:hypothetical protein
VVGPPRRFGRGRAGELCDSSLDGSLVSSLLPDHGTAYSGAKERQALKAGTAKGA